MGGASGWQTKPLSGRKALPGGTDPATDVPQAGLTLGGNAFGGRDTAEPTVCGFFHGRNAAETFWKGKPPKGESQERCRCETKPARDSREKPVKRVTKP
jgi:hypothetical protein